MGKYTIFGTMLGIAIMCFLLAISEEVDVIKDKLLFTITGIIFLISSYAEYKSNKL